MLKIKATRYIAVIITFITVFVSSFVYGQRASNPPTDLFHGFETPIAEVVTQFHKALQQGDQNKAVSYLTTDVVIVENDRVQRSLFAYQQGHLQDDINALKSSTAIFHELTLKVVGNIAISTAVRTFLEVEDKATEIKRHKLETMILGKQENGHWKINYIHWSS
ncbi:MULTISPECIES: DUF4440 domain-containing protein [unclassified Shewanella]|uniref:YybH family protein n=1 Tax=unclassified Shewanella TaxID=196818 RepID=UPI001BC3AE64|nr:MULTISPECIES: nuclear transport factor 2 family protein [unclassified Shewanella]GIU10699.1 hypothetical protein TUM4444_15380 [Shewanella sp. MBTL60-112-B1]GIU32821.1 hypothetical protein TUM4445_18980 [Shewanella sp. MBTL60-112-B2]